LNSTKRDRDFVMQLRDWFSRKHKYELLTDSAHTIKVGSSTLFQIRALRDFNNVKAGDLGGFIGSEKNLSQHGTCWVGPETAYCGDYELKGDTQDFSKQIICVTPAME